MEPRDNSKDNRRKLLTHHWGQNSQEYQCQFSFHWNHNDVRVDIRSFSTPPGKDRCVHFNFYINGAHILYKFHYSCYGGSPRGKTPELVSENYRLTFFASPGFFEACEEKIDQVSYQGAQVDVVQKATKDSWMSFYRNYRLGMSYDVPFKDPEIILWIKKTFHHRQASGILVFNYELYATNLYCITPTVGNFVCTRLYDHGEPGECGEPSQMGCEISDGKGDYRNIFWKRKGLEDLTIFEIMRFHKSLRCYSDWRDYDNFQALYKSAGLTGEEIDEQLRKGLSGLGLTREGE